LRDFDIIIYLQSVSGILHYCFFFVKNINEHIFNFTMPIYHSTFNSLPHTYHHLCFPLYLHKIYILHLSFVNPPSFQEHTFIYRYIHRFPIYDTTNGYSIAILQILNFLYFVSFLKKALYRTNRIFFM